jgi:hypothetical protein
VTSICSAAFTSRLLAAFAGSTSTVVSARSAAMSWMRPAGMSMWAEIGAAVSNFCIVDWALYMVCSLGVAVSDDRNATLHSRIWQLSRCA